MNDFDFQSEKEKFKLIERDTRNVIEKYENKFNQLDEKELVDIQLYYYLKKINTISNMTPKGNYYDNKKKEMISYYSNRFNDLSYRYYPDERNLNKVYSGIMKTLNGGALKMFADLNIELKNTYLKYDNNVYTVNSVSGIKELVPSENRENQYFNSINDGVYATGSYDNLLKYIGRACTSGLIANGKKLVYPTNPFSGIDNDKLILNYPVSIYLSSIDDFEPQYDFNISETGNVKIVFNGEWVSSNKQKCIEKQTDYLPKSFLDDYDVYYKDGKGKEELVYNNFFNKYK